MNAVLILLLPFLLSGVTHDFHVSRCEIVYRSERRSLEITQHMFADDVELGVIAASGFSGPLHLSTELERDTAEVLFKSYINDKLAVSVDGREVVLNYLGREPGEDNAAMWAYIEAPDCTVTGEITVRYDLLIEIFPDQKNILSFQTDEGAKQMFLLDRSNPEVTFQP